nr:hypothetical protein [Tanacetum cinerariifolium]
LLHPSSILLLQESQLHQEIQLLSKMNLKGKEDVMAQLKEMKRLADLKVEKEKSEKYLKKILNPATIRAQTQKMASHEAKKEKDV